MMNEDEDAILLSDDAEAFRHAAADTLIPIEAFTDNSDDIEDDGEDDSLENDADENAGATGQNSSKKLFKFFRGLAINVPLTKFLLNPKVNEKREEFHPNRFSAVSFSQVCATLYGLETIQQGVVQQPHQEQSWTYKICSQMLPPDEQLDLNDLVPVSDGASSKRPVHSQLSVEPLFQKRLKRNLTSNFSDDLSENEFLHSSFSLKPRADPLEDVVRDIELRLCRQGALADPRSYLGKGENRYDYEDPMFDDDEMVLYPLSYELRFQLNHFGLTIDDVAAAAVSHFTAPSSSREFDSQEDICLGDNPKVYDDSTYFVFDADSDGDMALIESDADDDTSIAQSSVSSRGRLRNNRSSTNRHSSPESYSDVDSEESLSSSSSSSVDIHPKRQQSGLASSEASAATILQNRTDNLGLLNWLASTSELTLNVEFRPSFVPLVSDLSSPQRERNLTRRAWLSLATTRLAHAIKAGRLSSTDKSQMTLFFKSQVCTQYLPDRCRRSSGCFDEDSTAVKVPAQYSSGVVDEVSLGLRSFHVLSAEDSFNDDDVKVFEQRQLELLERIKAAAPFQNPLRFANVISTELSYPICTLDVALQDEESRNSSMATLNLLRAGVLVKTLGLQLLEYAQLWNLKKHAARSFLSLTVEDDFACDPFLQDSQAHWSVPVATVMSRMFFKRFRIRIEGSRLSRILDLIVRITRRRSKNLKTFERRPIPQRSKHVQSCRKTLITSKSSVNRKCEPPETMDSSDSAAHSLDKNVVETSRVIPSISSVKHSSKEQIEPSEATPVSSRLPLPLSLRYYLRPLTNDAKSAITDLRICSYDGESGPNAVSDELYLDAKYVDLTLEKVIDIDMQVVHWDMKLKSEAHSTAQVLKYHSTSLAEARSVILESLMSKFVEETTDLDPNSTPSLQGWQVFHVPSRDSKSLFSLLLEAGLQKNQAAIDNLLLPTIVSPIDQLKKDLVVTLEAPDFFFQEFIIQRPLVFQVSLKIILKSLAEGSSHFIGKTGSSQNHALSKGTSLERGKQPLWSPREDLAYTDKEINSASSIPNHLNEMGDENKLDDAKLLNNFTAAPLPSRKNLSSEAQQQQAQIVMPPKRRIKAATKTTNKNISTEFKPRFYSSSSLSLISRMAILENGDTSPKGANTQKQNCSSRTRSPINYSSSISRAASRTSNSTLTLDLLNPSSTAKENNSSDLSCKILYPPPEAKSHRSYKAEVECNGESEVLRTAIPDARKNQQQTFDNICQFFNVNKLPPISNVFP